MKSHTLAPSSICDLSHSLCWGPLTDLGHISSVTYICHPLWFVCGHRKGILTSPLRLNYILTFVMSTMQKYGPTIQILVGSREGFLPNRKNILSVAPADHKSQGEKGPRNDYMFFCVQFPVGAVFIEGQKYNKNDQVLIACCPDFVTLFIS